MNIRLRASSASTPARPVLEIVGEGLHHEGVDRDDALRYCLTKPGAWRDEPWEGDPVAKVGPKVFAFIGMRGGIGLKCAATRDEADEWLVRYPESARVMPYLGRNGWNTLDLGGEIPEDEILAAIDDSYDAVVAKLAKKDRPVAP